MSAALEIPTPMGRPGRPRRHGPRVQRTSRLDRETDNRLLVQGKRLKMSLTEIQLEAMRRGLALLEEESRPVAVAALPPTPTVSVVPAPPTEREIFLGLWEELTEEERRHLNSQIPKDTSLDIRILGARQILSAKRLRPSTSHDVATSLAEEQARTPHEVTRRETEESAAKIRAEKAAAKKAEREKERKRARARWEADLRSQLQNDPKKAHSRVVALSRRVLASPGEAATHRQELFDLLDRPEEFLAAALALYDKQSFPDTR